MPMIKNEIVQSVNFGYYNIKNISKGLLMENDENLKILCRISHSESLQEAADLAFELLGNPIFITDSARTVLAYTKCVQIDSPFWQETIVNANIDSQHDRSCL